MVFEIDPDKPNIPALAPIALWTGIVVMIGSIMALILIAQGKILELLAVVSFRVKVRVGMDSGSSLLKSLPAAAATAGPGEKRPPIIPQGTPERVIHIPDSEAREQGVRLR